MVDIYTRKILPGGCNFKTVSELNQLLERGDLTSSDLDNLYQLRSKWHNFRCSRADINGISKAHIIEPSAVIFLDIKGTLYDGGTHGSSKGLLARSPLGDFRPISYDVIDAFGDMISRTMPQDFHVKYNINNGYEICPKDSAYGVFLIERPLDGGDFSLKTYDRNRRPKYMMKQGPFTVVFISSDDVKTQKNIVALFYYMSLYLDKMTALGYLYDNFRKEDEYIDGVISQIESLLYSKYDNDFMKFLEHEDKNFGKLFEQNIEEFKNTINGLYFLSTEESGKTKEELMEEFLESSTLKARVGHSNYQVFALGDDYDKDGKMLQEAFFRGGFGLVCGNYSRKQSSKYINLTQDLGKCGINLSYLPFVSSFTEFYNMLISELVMKRENELIEAMVYANHSVESDTVLRGLSVPCCMRKRK